MARKSMPIYVDQYNALKRFSDYLSEHEDEYADMKVKDKDWLTVKYSYLVLVSNLDLNPKELLTEYFGQTDIEAVFKTGKYTLLCSFFPSGQIKQSEARSSMTSSI